MNSAQPQLKIGLENSTAITCDHCGNVTFQEASYLRKISKILAGTSEDVLVPVPTFVCAKCGEVNEMFKISQFK